MRLGRILGQASPTQLLYTLCVVILFSSVIGFSVLPLAARAASFGALNAFIAIALLLVFVQTVIAGIVFPLAAVTDKTFLGATHVED